MALDPQRVRRGGAADSADGQGVRGGAERAGGGCGLAWALTCDVAIASEDAVIVRAFGRLGLLPEVGTSWALTRALGYQGAFALLASGEHLTAARALEAGLVQELVPAERTDGRGGRLVRPDRALPAHAVAMAKLLLRAASRRVVGRLAGDGGVRRAQLLHHQRLQDTVRAMAGS